MDTLKKHIRIELRSSYNNITLLLPAAMLAQALAVFEAAVIVAEVDYEGTMAHAERANIALRSLTPATFSVLSVDERKAEVAREAAEEAALAAKKPTGSPEESL